METKDERRRYIRAPLSLPVELKTPQGIIHGKTANISTGGLALILFIKKPELINEFEIIIKISDNHVVPITCQKVWSGNIITDESVFNGVGVRFTKISSSDRDIISELVKEYYML